MLANGSLFGTLCAIHPTPQPESIVEEKALLELLGALLSTILDSEFRAAEESRRSERLQVEALTDQLTGLYNRRAWQQLLTAEEDRCRRHGHPAAVFIIDLDDLKEVNDAQGHAAGDALLVNSAQSLRRACRSQQDILARLGGDEFGILAVECDRAGAEGLLGRVRAALEETNVRASVGLALRDPAKGLLDASAIADGLMYVEKRSR